MNPAQPAGRQPAKGLTAFSNAPRWPAAVDLLVVALLGGLHSLTVVHTQAWPVQLLTVSALAWRAAAASPRRAVALGMSFGTAWLAASIWWLFISMHRYGGLPAWMAATAVLLLSAFMATFLAAGTGRFRPMARWQPAARRAAVGRSCGCWRS